MSEGFVDAKVIARKFITLYYLSRDLLSKQKHYDWGLRAIKSLLRQAGALKRHPSNETKAEQSIIMRALWDFNKAKIVLDDLPIFRRLLEDLFKDNSNGDITKEDELVNRDLNMLIEVATEHKDVNLQKDVSFTTKTRQLSEILEVRHCCFVMGPTGAGKTAVWKTLYAAQYLKECRGFETGIDKLSPKAIHVDELYGYFDRNKTWHYGILSSIMKKMCKNEFPYKATMQKKWIILDGDIDPDWIESLNTVMDDNKVLTLNNGDRFPLDEYMRLLFEISNLRNATPATASRGGCLFINESDIGIRPFFDKWVKQKYSTEKYDIVRGVVNVLFKETFDKIKGEFRDRHCSQIVEMNSIQNVCTIFQHLIEKNIDEINNAADDERKKLIVEGIYFFAFMWGAGGSLKDRKDMIPIINHSINKKLRLPDQGSCFDYFFDVKNNWTSWETQVTQYEIPEGSLFENIIIPTEEVTKLNRIIKYNILEERPVLFIGDAGTGKTAVVRNFLNSIGELSNDSLSYKSYIINFNSFTDSSLFQKMLESQIKQRIRNEYGPIGNTKLIYFLDDLNMPGMDKYGTQTHVELMTQILNYKEVYDRKDLDQKKILQDILFLGCQNPKAGSFVIDSRLQRQFTVIASSEPSPVDISGIYMTILNNHYKQFKFKGESIEKITKDIMSATANIVDAVR
jgi:dynein heavy chain